MKRVDYHKIFHTGVIPEEMSDKEILAEALTAWALTMSNLKPPTNFGKAMVQVSKRLGVPATPDELKKLAN